MYRRNCNGASAGMEMRHVRLFVVRAGKVNEGTPRLAAPLAASLIDCVTYRAAAAAHLYGWTAQ